MKMTFLFLQLVNNFKKHWMHVFDNVHTEGGTIINIDGVSILSIKRNLMLQVPQSVICTTADYLNANLSRNSCISSAYHILNLTDNNTAVTLQTNRMGGGTGGFKYCIFIAAF